MVETTETLLSRAAAVGDPGAQFELAMAMAASGQDRDALTWMTRAAVSGLPLADAHLGLWQVMGRIAERNSQEGLRRIERAAGAGNDIASLLLAGLHAMGTHAPQDWDQAADWLIASARLGNVRALTQLSLLLPESFADRELFGAHAAAAGYPPAVKIFRETRPTTSPDFDRARLALDLRALAAAPKDEALLESPRLRIARRLLPLSWCYYICALAEPTLEPSDVHNATLGRTVLGVRTSHHMAFGPANSDPLLAILAHRTAAWTGTDIAWAEDTNVLRYKPGQEYQRHVDFFDPQIPTIWAEAERAGQRTVTVLIWLNDEYQGGETEFPLARQSIRGAAGDALAFWNTMDDGSPDRSTVHAGRPVLRGEKWLITQWIRDRPQKI